MALLSHATYMLDRAGRSFPFIVNPGSRGVAQSWEVTRCAASNIETAIALASNRK